VRARAIALVLVISLQSAAFAAPARKSFDSLDDAVNAFVAATRAADQRALLSILGPEGQPLVSSGDDVADRALFQRFVAAYDRAHRLEGGGGKVVLYIGEDDFPFPIPLVPDGPRWVWDTDAGNEEILNRRIGRNELAAIEVCLAYVDAQREYYAWSPNGTGMLEFAQRLASTKGKKDGLFWETKPGQRPSPLGPLVAEARAAGYRRAQGGSPAPYHGYLYRMLFAQGPDARGGAYDFVVKGHMIGGFALVAFPASYGVSGIMTFIVSHDGVVYQKDFGPRTAEVGNTMKTYNPDRTWRKAADDASTRR
jgi:Protein of unknown function (DUF2950)